MKKDTPVIFVAPWSSYRGQRGVVVSPPPNLTVLVAGETKAIAVRRDEIVPDEPSEISLTGAE